jgi:hypothetical protein
MRTARGPLARAAIRGIDTSASPDGAENPPAAGRGRRRARDATVRMADELRAGLSGDLRRRIDYRAVPAAARRPAAAGG